MLLAYAYNPHYLSSQWRDRDLQGMNDSVPQEMPKGDAVMRGGGGRGVVMPWLTLLGDLKADEVDAPIRVVYRQA